MDLVGSEVQGWYSKGHGAGTTLNQFGKRLIPQCSQYLTDRSIGIGGETSWDMLSMSSHTTHGILSTLGSESRKDAPRKLLIAHLMGWTSLLWI